MVVAEGEDAVAGKVGSSNGHKPTIALAAGKGGTGKTLVATSLALAVAQNGEDCVQLVDCDVEEPNADLLLHPQIQHNEAVHVLVPKVNMSLCTRCGRCAEVCQFSAIAVIRDAVLTFPELCAACGACAYACPEDAISEVERHVGVVSKGTGPEGIGFYQGRMNVGEQRSGFLLRAVKDYIADDKVSIIDAPPGTSCPMQESVEGSDYCILVTEPTPFGLSDLGAAYETCRTLGVPAGVIINRHGIGDEGVEDYCAQEGIDVLLRIPHDRAIAEAYSRGETLAAAMPEWGEKLAEMYAELAAEL